MGTTALAPMGLPPLVIQVVHRVPGLRLRIQKYVDIPHLSLSSLQPAGLSLSAPQELDLSSLPCLVTCVASMQGNHLRMTAGMNV
jgi:hypothetical protein